MVSSSMLAPIGWKALVFGLMALGCAHSSASTISTIPGVTDPTIGGIVADAVGSADMVGMTVTATFVGGGPQTSVWTSTGITAADWSLSLQAPGTDTIFNTWEFVNTSNNPLQSLVLDGFPGMVLFDRTAPATGTPGSNFGVDFAETPTQPTATATYSREVALTGSAGPVGDLFYQLAVDFGMDGISGDWTFSQDTDRVAAAVSAPASLALALLGLAVLGRPRRGER